jgi:hypothetical protein
MKTSITKNNETKEIYFDSWMDSKPVHGISTFPT